VNRIRSLVFGGSRANAHLTAIVAMMLVPLLAAEGATLLDVRSLLTVHAFIGLLLVPVIALKLGSTGWRLLSYYRRREEYVLHGPPQLVIRVLVAPVLVASTVLLFGTGIALLALDQTEGMLVGLHKASFLVWVGALGLHVLTRLPVLLRSLRLRRAGTSLRIAVATVSVIAGVGLATRMLPAMDHLQDNVSAHVGVDAH
jgi:hypothetical protein